MALPLREGYSDSRFHKSRWQRKSIAFLQNYCVLSFLKVLKFFLNAWLSSSIYEKLS